MRKLRVLVLVVLGLALTASAASAAELRGEVSIENDVNSGYNVTVTPLDENFQSVANSSTTQVENGSYVFEDIADAESYFLRLSYLRMSHYKLINSTDQGDFVLNETVSGEVVRPNGSNVTGRAINIMNSQGLMVGASLTRLDGSFSFEPLQPDKTYTVEVIADQVPYRKKVTTGVNSTNISIEVTPPTDDIGVIESSGGQLADHVIQVSNTPPANMTDASDDASLYVIETMNVINTADRPFQGRLEIGVPEDSQPSAAMLNNQRVPYEREGDTAYINTTIAAGQTAQIGIAYSIPSYSLSKAIKYDTGTVAVVPRGGYTTDNLDYSANLVVGNAPIPMLTSSREISSGEEISVTFPETPNGTASGDTGDTGTGGDTGAGAGTGGDGSGQNGGDGGSSLPLTTIGIAVVALIVAGVVVYKVL
ncbi:hypothetical protein ACEU6E_09855 [Halorutilales archaeon Cl-col2-1]